LTPGAKKFEAGCAAQKRRWDLSRITPPSIKCQSDMSAFWKEALAHAAITGADVEIAISLLSGYGIRQIARMRGQHRVEIQKSARRIYKAVEGLIRDNAIWMENFKPQDREKTAFVINRNRRKMTYKVEPQKYLD